MRFYRLDRLYTPLSEHFYELYETSFTPKNFPSDGNEQFNSVGERTNYVASEHNERGFVVNQPSKIIKPDGTKVDVAQGDRVYLTRPGKLARGKDIGAADGSGVYAKVSKVSPEPEDFLGYIQLSKVTKPAGKNQARVGTGANAQNNLAEYVKDMVGEENYEFVSMARKGSTAPDLVVKLYGEKIQFEIKGASNPKAPITFFDKSVRRGVKVEILDHFASVLTKGRVGDFTQLVDEYKQKDPTIGFPGDEGTGKSGKLPSEFNIVDSGALQAMRQLLIDHFAKGESGGTDNYFAVMSPSGEPAIFHTGHGPNPLKLPPLPALRGFKIATYGGPSGGAMRVGIKVTLA